MWGLITMTEIQDHYLKQELYSLVRSDPKIFDFLEAGSLDGIWYWDLEKPDQEWMSPRFWETLGYDPSSKKHLASEWQDLINPDDLADAIKQSRAHCENPEIPYDQIVRYRHRKGHTVWVRCRGIAIRDQAGKPIRMLGAHNDVTALKQAEIQHQQTVRMLEQLRRAQISFMTLNTVKESFEIMLNALLEGTDSEYGFIGEVLYDKETNDPYLKTHAITNIAWNAETRTFYEQNAPTGMEFYNLNSLFGNVMVTKEPVISNTPAEDPRRCGLPPGHPPLNHFLGLPFFHGDSMVGMVGVANRPGGYDEDIIKMLEPFLSTSANLIVGLRNETQRQAMEEAQNQAQAELTRAKEQAEKASITKSRFLATMSHEIRTPLNGILGMAQLLLTPQLEDSERTEAAETILNSGQTLLTLLNDLLDLAKIEEGKLTINKLAVDPAHLVKETINLFKSSAEIKDLDLTYEISPSLNRRYISDPVRLRQMLSNFVSNALKFTEEGSIHISVRAEKGYDKRNYLIFSVTDTGIGISEEDQKSLFQPFTQLDNSTTRTFSGTGLGLFLIQRMAHMLRGTAGVTSKLGEGSTFWFRVIAEDFVLPTSPKVNKPKEQLIKETPKNVKILVVEDNRVNLKVISKLLTKSGYQHKTAINGEVALELIKQGQFQPHIILMDCHMPKMDGFQTTIAIRELECDKDLPHAVIIALTADAYLENKQHCFEVGMDDFLEKPIKYEQLVQTLEKWTRQEYI